MRTEKRCCCRGVGEMPAASLNRRRGKRGVDEVRGAKHQEKCRVVERVTWLELQLIKLIAQIWTIIPLIDTFYCRLMILFISSQE